LAVLPVLVGIAIRCHRSSDRQLSAAFPHSLGRLHAAESAESCRSAATPRASERTTAIAPPGYPSRVRRTAGH
jgi:hypothetical protein